MAAKSTEVAPTAKLDTSAMSRRLRLLMASIVDLAIVLIPTAIVALVVSERFSFTRDTNGLALFKPADQQRIDLISTGFSRAHELGNTLYVLSGTSLTLVFGALIILLIIVLGIAPLALDSDTFGQRVIPQNRGPKLSISPKVAFTPPLASPFLDDQTSEPVQAQSAQSWLADYSTTSLGSDLSTLISNHMKGIAHQRHSPKLEREANKPLPKRSSRKWRKKADNQTSQTEPPAAQTNSEHDNTSSSDTQEMPELNVLSHDEIAEFSYDPSFDKELLNTIVEQSDSPNQSEIAELQSQSTAPLQTEGEVADAPVWNDDWKAWLFYQKGRGWLRHDPQTNQWILIADTE